MHAPVQKQKKKAVKEQNRLKRVFATFFYCSYSTTDTQIRFGFCHAFSSIALMANFYF
jgi:hypothetical protein